MNRNHFPPLIFAVLAAPGLMTSGLYIGKMLCMGTSTGDLLRAAAFAAFGVLMLFGAVTGSRNRKGRM